MERLWLADRLSWGGLLRLAAAQVLAPAEAGLVCRLAPAPRLARLARWVPGLSWVRVEGGAIGAVRIDGANAPWDSDEQLRAVARHLLERMDCGRLSGLPCDTGMADHFLAKTVFNHEVYPLRRALVLATLHQSLAPEARPVLLRPWQPWGAEVAAATGLAVAQYPAPSALFDLIRPFLAAVRNLGRRPGPSAPPPAGPGRVAVQYHHGITEGAVSDMPWFAHSGLPRERVLVYCDGEATLRRYRAHGRAQLAEAGFASLDLSQWRSPEGRWPQLRRLGRALADVARLRRAGLGRAVWAAGRLLSLDGSIAYWHAFFATHNIVAHCHIGDREALLPAKLVALETLRGGVDLSFQFSGTGWPLPTEARTARQALFLNWGPANAAMMDQCDRLMGTMAPQVQLAMGHLNQRLAVHSPRDDVREAVAELRRHGCVLVIAVLDSVANDDIVVSVAARDRFVRCLVALAEGEPRIGLVMKPQDSYGVPGAEALVAAGRAAILDPQVRTFQLYPHVDFAVGLGANSSAAMEAAIAELPHAILETPAVYWHPLHAVAPPGLIARDEAAMAAIVAAWLDGGLRVDQQPGWRDYLDWVSPFRDGLAQERFGRLVGWLVEAIDRDGRIGPGLDRVVDRYAQAYGAKAVIRRGAPTF